MMEKSAANSDRCDLHIYSVYQVHDQMHLSSWHVEAYMRFYISVSWIITVNLSLHLKGGVS